ncbi:hypothetical protein BDR22DRAFT_816790 [Usnea florida]
MGTPEEESPQKEREAQVPIIRTGSISTQRRATHTDTTECKRSIVAAFLTKDMIVRTNLDSPDRVAVVDVNLFNEEMLATLRTNREGSTRRLNDRQALGPRAPTRPYHENVPESHNSADIEGPCFAEIDRRGNRARPGYKIIGYWTELRKQDGGRAFVPNPCLTGRVAVGAAERAADPPSG